MKLTIDGRPVQAHPDEARSVEAHPDEAHPDEAHPDEARSVEAHPDEARPVDVHAIDGRLVTTVLELAEAAGIDIPHLCHHPGRRHPGGCMLCLVEEGPSGRVVPACATVATEGMEIRTKGEALEALRRGQLDLLLGEHRGDCEGPCRAACPQDLDLALFLDAVAEDPASVDFPYDPAICEECGGRCERACRRARLDGAVAIRDLLGRHGRPETGRVVTREERKARYRHHGGGLGRSALEAMDRRLVKGGADGADGEAARRCLRCACSAREDCRLRELATRLGVRQGRFRPAAARPVEWIDGGELVFEPGKCVRCGSCVEAGEEARPGRGPVMAGRGDEARIAPPQGLDYPACFAGLGPRLAGLCPTGALSLRPKHFACGSVESGTESDGE